MAVVTGKRGENELEVMTRAKELAAYTLNICKQEKHFPKRDRWILTQPIVREALDACTCIRRANAVNVCTREEYLYRHLQQEEGYAHLKALLMLIELTHETVGLEIHTVEVWTELAVKAEKKLFAWKKRDTERFKDL